MKNIKSIFLKNKKRLILLLVAFISVFMLIDWDNPEKENQYDTFEMEDVSLLEKRLSRILGNIEGAGRVDVMITLESEGEKIILKDSQWGESDSFFSTSEDSSSKEKTVMKKDGSREEPFVRKQTKAEVRGVIVCCDGAYDDTVKNEIVSSCIAVLDVPVTRVSVVKRKE